MTDNSPRSFQYWNEAIAGYDLRHENDDSELDALRAEYERLRAVERAANDAFLAFTKAEELADDHVMVTAMSALGAALDQLDTWRESASQT